MKEQKEEILEYLFRKKEEKVSLEELKNNFNYLNLDEIINSLFKEKKIIIENGNIILTQDGSIEGESIKDKHEFVEDFLKEIGVPGDFAHEKACEIEHHVKEEKFENIVSLLTLNVRESGEIVLIRGGKGLIQRLYDMGLTPGTCITILKKVPFGPVEILLRGYHLALGQGVANRIWVRKKS